MLIYSDSVRVTDVVSVSTLFISTVSDSHLRKETSPLYFLIDQLCVIAFEYGECVFHHSSSQQSQAMDFTTKKITPIVSCPIKYFLISLEIVHHVSTTDNISCSLQQSWLAHYHHQHVAFIHSFIHSSFTNITFHITCYLFLVIIQIISSYFYQVKFTLWQCKSWYDFQVSSQALVK